MNFYFYFSALDTGQHIGYLARENAAAVPTTAKHSLLTFNSLR